MSQVCSKIWSKPSRHLTQSMQEVNQRRLRFAHKRIWSQSKCVGESTETNRKCAFIIVVTRLTLEWWVDSSARRKCPNRWRKRLLPQCLPQSQTPEEGVQHWERKNTATSITVSPHTSPVIWHVDAETVNRRGVKSNPGINKYSQSLTTVPQSFPILFNTPVFKGGKNHAHRNDTEYSTIYHLIHTPNQSFNVIIIHFKYAKS